MAELTTLDVLLHDRKIGILTHLPNDQNFFVFDTAYVDDPQRATLSLSFKDSFGGLITKVQPRKTRLPPFFSNLLPEGALREYLAERAKVKSVREFHLAWALGRDLPGALQIVPTDGSTAVPDDETGPTPNTTNTTGEALRFSLAGVQLKFSAVQKATGGLTIPANGTGGSWIVKLPSQKFAGVPENEFAMMELARSVGIDVPETKLVPIKEIQGLPDGIEVLGDKAFAIKRFDREPDGRKVHIEDFAQVFGVYPERKYEKASYRNIANAIWVETGEPGITEFIRRLIFNALIGNADMHLKNWSLIYPDTRTAELAPAYDFVSTIVFMPDNEMALSFVDSKAFASLTREQFVRFAAKVALSEKLTVRTIGETISAFSGAWKNTAIKAIDDKTRQTIEAHLKTIPIWREFNG
ncbi:MAG TPA: HipA domain-containing protein [Steroidobacteraceae bacterium]